MKKSWMRILAACLALVCLLATVPVSGLAAQSNTGFSDIPADFWAVNEIQYMAQRGYLKGKEDGSFCPTETITRKTVAMLLYRFEGEPEINGLIRFTDVKRDRYYDAILWASRAGIVNGYSDNTFHPDDIISRQHFAAMLHRYVQYKGCVTEGNTDKNIEDVTDFKDIYGWAVNECQWAYENELITGRADGTFDPQGNTSRAQLAVIMARLLESVFAGAAPYTVAAPNPVTANPWDMDYSQSMVDSSWFDDVLFIGDSRTVGLRDYARSGNADYFCSVGMGVSDAFREYNSDRDFYYTDLATLLQQNNYGKVIVNLGINTCGYPSYTFMSWYQTLVNRIRENAPNAKIILMSMMACGRGKEAELSCFGPDNLFYLNNCIAELADYETIYYVDVNTAFAGEDRYLPSSVSSDGCHPYLTYYQRWADWVGYIAAQMGI